MRLLDPDEVAVRLAMPRSTVLALARGNGLPHVRIGRHVRFPEAALDAWIAQRTSYTPTDEGSPSGERGRHGVSGARPAKAVGRKRHRVQDAVGMEAAQLVAGHTNPRMTASYITVRDGLLARAAEAAQEAIG